MLFADKKQQTLYLIFTNRRCGELRGILRNPESCSRLTKTNNGMNYSEQLFSV